MIGTFEDLLKAERDGVTDFTLDGKCSGCGQCCSDLLPVSRAEIERIHRYVKAHNIKEHHHNVVAVGLDFTCPFRDNVKRVCAIYSVRPGICRAFKCDYDPRQIETNKELFHSRHDVVSMRHEFFGGDDSFEVLVNLAKGARR